MPLTDDELRSRVRALLHANRREGFSKLLKSSYYFIQPSRHTYMYQWFWDTCFHIFMLCSLQEYALAKRNLQSLLAMQEDSGFIGHMIFWKGMLPGLHVSVLQSRPTLSQLRPHMSSIIQPSFIGQALQRIYDETKDAQFLSEMLPKVKKYLDWLSQNRDFDGDGLLSIISPFECGMDFKPSFDSILGNHTGMPGPRLIVGSARVDLQNFLRSYDLTAIHRAHAFVVKEVTVNTAYVRDLLAVSNLCAVIGDTIEAQRYRLLAEKVTQSMMELMYDAEDIAFYDIVCGTNRKLPVRTPTILFPGMLPGIPADIFPKLIERHLLNPEEFALPYPLPSVAANETAFYPRRSLFLWRGPTWIFSNWFLYDALKERGFPDVAAKLLQSCKSLIIKSGFREYYDPMTGVGGGEKDFTWSGLCVDMR